MSISRRALLGAAASAAGLLALPHAREAGASPDPARERIRQRNLPNVPLVTHEGEPVRFYDDLVKDRVVAINMIYTSCKTSCPLTMANLVRVQKLLGERMGRDIFMYSITLDPKVDSVEVLGDYAKGFETGKGWKLLTGKPGDIQNLRRRLGFLGSNRETDLDKDFHTGTVRYGNEPARGLGMGAGRGRAGEDHGVPSFRASVQARRVACGAQLHAFAEPARARSVRQRAQAPLGPARELAVLVSAFNSGEGGVRFTTFAASRKVSYFAGVRSPKCARQKSLTTTASVDELSVL